MRAIQLTKSFELPELREVPMPEPGPGQVLLKVTAAGLCHSDIALMEGWAEDHGIPLPMTLGHEVVGTIADAGAGVKSEVTVGEPVMIYGAWGCGRCRACLEGYENYCVNVVKEGILSPGLGRDGGCAEYMIVEHPRFGVPMGDLDPVQAAPLTDAALTPYHALMVSRDKLGAGSTAVVLGAGGLGHVAIQLIKYLTPATVVAIDIDPGHRDLAKQVGADVCLPSDQSAVAAVTELAKGEGADVVFDFVGVQPTIDLGAQMTKIRGHWDIVGVNSGRATLGFGVQPYECQVTSPYWGTRTDLSDVIELAQRGVLDVHTEVFNLSDGAEAYHRLHDGTIMGRAVLVP
jgi:propanol-preferring alcohol dehydrogenase